MTAASVGRHLVEHALFWCGLVAFGALCLLWSLTAAVLYRVLPRRQGSRLGQFAIMAGFRFYLSAMQAIGVFRCDLRALDTLRDAGALVIAPNHPSLLDAVVVMSRLPRVVCITKASLWDNLFLGGSVRLAGYIRNDAPLNLVRQAMRSLGDGQQLLIFPEGTRTIRPPVDAFKGGFLLMARRAGVPVQTVFLENNSGYLGKGWPLFRKPPIPVVVTARLGRRFEVPADLHVFMAELEHHYRQELGAVAPGLASPIDA
jgi:1-acyl-sn-glycerol-3-phosphate acyltransferase